MADPSNATHLSSPPAASFDFTSAPAAPSNPSYTGTAPGTSSSTQANGQFRTNGSGSGASHSQAQSQVYGQGLGQGQGTGQGGTSHAAAREGEEDGPVMPDLTALFQAKREEEQARKDRSLAEFLVMLDGYKPLIPEEVTEYYLQRAGFECSDPRLKRLLSLSAQKFISDLSRDAFHFAKLRVTGPTAGRGRPPAAADRNRVVLTMDDLSLALAEHGVNVKKPDYYL